MDSKTVLSYPRFQANLAGKCFRLIAHCVGMKTNAQQLNTFKMHMITNLQAPSMTLVDLSLILISSSGIVESELLSADFFQRTILPRAIAQSQSQELFYYSLFAIHEKGMYSCDLEYFVFSRPQQRVPQRHGDCETAQPSTHSPSRVLACVADRLPL